MAINPLQAPINYAVDVQSPFQAALGGLQIGAGLEQMDAARQKRAMEMQQLQAAQAQQAQFQSGLNSFFAKPPEQRTFEELQPLLIGANKQQFDALKLVGEQMSAEKLGSSKRFTSQVLLALEANPATAQTMLEERLAVETDPNQKRGFQTILDISKEDPAKAAQFVESLGAGTFGKDWYEGVTKVRDERRTAEQAPLKLRQELAAADKAEAEAKVKMETAPDDIAKAKATREFEQAKAAKEQIEAQFASPLAQAELNKRIAETLAPSVREAIDFKNLSPADQAVFQNLQILKKPPAAVTNVNVSNVDKTAAGELGKLVPDLYTQMNAASDLTGELARYRTALGTAITGPFADRRLQVAQVANAFGLIGDKGINATRELIQGNAEMSLKARSLIAGQGQGPITEGEQALLVKARAGDINFTKGELNTLFNIFDRAAKAQYDQSRKLLQSATTQSPTAQIFLDAAKPFGAQTAPPVQPAASPQTAPVAQPAAPANIRSQADAILRGGQ